MGVLAFALLVFQWAGGDQPATGVGVEESAEVWGGTGTNPCPQRRDPKPKACEKTVAANCTNDNEGQAFGNWAQYITNRLGLPQAAQAKVTEAVTWIGSKAGTPEDILDCKGRTVGYVCDTQYGWEAKDDNGVGTHGKTRVNHCPRPTKNKCYFKENFKIEFNIALEANAWVFKAGAGGNFSILIGVCKVDANDQTTGDCETFLSGADCAGVQVGNPGIN